MRISDWSSDVCSSDLLRLLVNGEERQHSNTRDMIFDCAAQVADLSTAMTLEPGDVIFTGTPSGVAAGMRPPRWLKAGDRVRAEISGIGHIEALIVDEVAEIHAPERSEEHTSELQSLMRISYAVFCLKTKKTINKTHT